VCGGLFNLAVSSVLVAIPVDARGRFDYLEIQDVEVVPIFLKLRCFLPIGIVIRDCLYVEEVILPEPSDLSRAAKAARERREFIYQADVAIVVIKDNVTTARVDNVEDLLACLLLCASQLLVEDSFIEVAVKSARRFNGGFDVRVSGFDGDSFHNVCVCVCVGGLHLTGCQPSQIEAALPIVSPVLRHQACLSASRLSSPREATRSISPRQVAVGLSKNDYQNAHPSMDWKKKVKLFFIAA
jgi:hypothetical protein